MDLERRTVIGVLGHAHHGSIEEWRPRTLLHHPLTAPGQMPGVSTDFQDFERGTLYAFGQNYRTVVRNGSSVFATGEHFVDWNRFGQTWPDGDVIGVSFGQNFPQLGITMTLNAGSAVTWWKGVSLSTPGRPDSHEIFTEGAHTSASVTILPSALDGGDVYLHFKRAKALGVHTGMYYLGRADRLLGTHVTFTWLKDR